MVSASWSIEISRPPEDVFDFVADLDDEPKTDVRVSFEFTRRRPGGDGRFVHHRADDEGSDAVDGTDDGLEDPQLDRQHARPDVEGRARGGETVTDQTPDRHSSSADAAAIRWGEKHPDEDVDHPAPSSSHEDEDEEVVPNRHSASAEAASLRWHEEHDDEEE
jgi:hypothetical protein